MKVKKGCEYNGLKLGEEVILKEDGKKYEIIGFDLSVLAYDFIAINKQGLEYGIQDTPATYFLYYKETNSFEWVGLHDIEKNTKGKQIKKALLRGLKKLEMIL